MLYRTNRMQTQQKIVLCTERRHHKNNGGVRVITWLFHCFHSPPWCLRCLQLIMASSYLNQHTCVSDCSEPGGISIISKDWLEAVRWWFWFPTKQNQAIKMNKETKYIKLHQRLVINNTLQQLIKLKVNILLFNITTAVKLGLSRRNGRELLYYIVTTWSF